MTTSSLVTILDFLRWGISEMNAHDLHFGHGTDNSQDETMLLLSEALHLPYPISSEYLPARLTDTEKETLTHFFHQRIHEKIPVPYLIHRAWFADLPFYVDDRVLIPRSPIAELIKKQFSPWIAVNKVNQILDLCTGSGCIAIACAHAFPNAHVDAIDISADALTVAQENIEGHQCEETVNLWLTDLYTALPKTARYDIIVSNPPYVSADELAALPNEYHHEPEIALLSQENSPDGLEIVDSILAGALQHLNPWGILIVEVGNAQEALINKYPHLPFLWLAFEHGGSGVFLLTAEQLSA